MTNWITCPFCDSPDNRVLDNGAIYCTNENCINYLGELPLVYLDIHTERIRQNDKWGGPEHDDEHGANAWQGFRAVREARLKQALGPNFFDAVTWHKTTRKNLVEIAALAVAQIESLDRLYKAAGLI